MATGDWASQAISKVFGSSRATPFDEEDVDVALAVGHERPRPLL